VVSRLPCEPRHPIPRDFDTREITHLDETCGPVFPLAPLLMGRGCSFSVFFPFKKESRHGGKPSRPLDLLIVNLAGDFTAWQISRYVESTLTVSGTLVLVDRRPSEPGLDVLTDFPESSGPSETTWSG